MPIHKLTHRQKTEHKASESLVSLDTSMLRDSEIPEAFWKLQADTFPGSSSSLKKVETYIKKIEEAQRERISLHVFGPTQSGKTFALTHVLRHCLSLGMSCQYWTFNYLVDLMIRPESGLNFAKLISAPDVLAVDDVIAPEGKREGKVAALSRLIKARHDQGKLLLLASSHTPDEIAAHFSPAIGESLNTWSLNISFASMGEIIRTERMGKRLSIFGV